MLYISVLYFSCTDIYMLVNVSQIVYNLRQGLQFSTPTKLNEVSFLGEPVSRMAVFLGPDFACRWSPTTDLYLVTII